MSGVDLTFPVRVGEQDKLFGSVTSRDIARSLVALGHPVDSRRIVLDEPIKALGVYQVPVKLTAGVTAEVKVWVVADRTVDASAQDSVAETAPEEQGAEATDAAETLAEDEIGEASEEETFEA